MEDGFYWYKAYTTKNQWEVCRVRTNSLGSRSVDFFGQCSQEVGNKWITDCVTFGDQIQLPPNKKKKST